MKIQKPLCMSITEYLSDFLCLVEKMEHYGEIKAYYTKA